jgi:hypothetical protein
MKKRMGKKSLSVFSRKGTLGMLLRVLEEAVKLKGLQEQTRETCDLLLRQNEQQAAIIKNLTNQLNDGKEPKRQGECSVENA